MKFLLIGGIVMIATAIVTAVVYTIIHIIIGNRLSHQMEEEYGKIQRFNC